MPLLRVAVAFGVVAGLSFVAAPEQAQARPQYLAAFGKKYDNIKDLTLKNKCFVCHPKPDDRKIHNDYGTALEKFFGEEKNVKGEKINEGLVAIEKGKSKVENPEAPGEMKTFGELIKEGKLPGTNEEEPKDEV